MSFLRALEDGNRCNIYMYIYVFIYLTVRNIQSLKFNNIAKY